MDNRTLILLLLVLYVVGVFGSLIVKMVISEGRYTDHRLYMLWLDIDDFSWWFITLIWPIGVPIWIIIHFSYKLASTFARYILRCPHMRNRRR